MEELSILCLGTNQGNRLDNLTQATNFIQSEIGVIQNSSSIYESEPWGYADNVNYFNQVVSIYTDFSPQKLLQKCLQIETIMGRKRRVSGYESRVIDIDILFYGTQQIEFPNLIIPHPRLHLRKFVLEPLKEIFPGFIHPLLKKSIQELSLSCNDKSLVKKNPSTQ